jgi:hypothetical protein
MATRHSGACLLALSLLVSAACGGQTGSGSAPSSSGTTGVADLCKALCDRDARCHTLKPDCQSGCVAEVKNPNIYDSDFLASYASCLESADCSVSDDSCLTQAANQTAPNWQNDPLYLQCNQRQQECQTFSDDNCAGAIFFNTDGRQQLSSCMAQSCAAIADCLSALI